MTDQNYPEGKFICGFSSAFVVKKGKKEEEKKRVLAAERGWGGWASEEIAKGYMKRIAAGYRACFSADRLEYFKALRASEREGEICTQENAGRKGRSARERGKGKVGGFYRALGFNFSNCAEGEEWSGSAEDCERPGPSVRARSCCSLSRESG